MQILYQGEKVQISSHWGGEKLGRAYQITLMRDDGNNGDLFLMLTAAEMAELVLALDSANTCGVFK